MSASVVVRAPNHAFAALLLALLTLGLLPPPASAQERRPPVCTDSDYVATTVWGNDTKTEAVVLATRARTSSFIGPKPVHWRFRILPANTQGSVIQRVLLSTSATRARIEFRDGRSTDVDLTRQILELPAPNAPGRSTTSTQQQATQTPVFESQSCQPVPIDPATQERLNSELRRHMTDEGFANGGNSGWEFFAVQVDTRLYAPILQPLHSEPVLPSALETLSELAKRLPTGLSATEPRFEAALFRQYQLSDRRCVMYVHEQPADKGALGSWVLQYWLYYPFDVGGVGAHLHDSEHIFVEVDKLGGTVRRVAAAGHGIWAPNNIYHTFQRNAVPVALPLFAIIEYGKHATAPDINGDGMFTPGVDSNNYYDAAKVWGIRDTIGVTDSNLKSFASSMMVKREKADALVPTGVREVFDLRQWPELGAKDNKSCEVRPLPPAAELPKQKQHGVSFEAAKSQIGSHSDYRDPEKILKPALYPPLSVRFNYFSMPTADREDPTLSRRSHRATIGVAAELSYIFSLFSVEGGIPGRIAADVVIDPATRFGDRVSGLTLRYESLLSNLFGFYGELGKIRDDIPPGAPTHPNRTSWAGAGLLYEQGVSFPGATTLRLDRRFTVRADGGLTYNNFYGLSWNARMGFGITFRSPHRDFGIGREVPSPY